MPKQVTVPGTLSEHAYVRIREKILRGDLPLGAAISRRRLAEDFKMSFLPVSEALRRLEQEGLVESRPRAGTRVRVPSARDVRERCIMREALETQAARLFTEKASADERIELRSMAIQLEAMEVSADNGQRNPQALYRVQVYHLAFHTRIAECSGCAALCQELERNQVLIFNWLYDTAAQQSLQPGAHLGLVESLAGSDPDAAEAAMREHVRYGLEEIQTEIAARFVGSDGPFSGSGELFSTAHTGAKPRAWRVK
jgi:DNA-binding GntR family transcriptional regulator